MIRNKKGWWQLPPDNKDDALEQSEWWKPAGSGWVRIDSLETSHLENLRDWLTQHPHRFKECPAAGSGLPTPSIWWMMERPLYKSIDHEIQIRAQREKRERNRERLREATQWVEQTPQYIQYGEPGIGKMMMIPPEQHNRFDAQTLRMIADKLDPPAPKPRVTQSKVYDTVRTMDACVAGYEKRNVLRDFLRELGHEI